MWMRCILQIDDIFSGACVCGKGWCFTQGGFCEPDRNECLNLTCPEESVCVNLFCRQTQPTCVSK